MGNIVRGTKTGTGTTAFGPGTTVKSSEVNTDFNTIYSEFNGNIDNDNIKAGAAIANSKIDLSSVTQSVSFTNVASFSALTAASLKLTGAVVITGIFDEDTMVSDSAVGLPTQQSVKAYADAITTVLNGKFSTTTGHDHDGSDSKKVLATNLDATGITDTHVLYNNAGTIAGMALPGVDDFSTGTIVVATAATPRTTTSASFEKVKELTPVFRGGTLSVLFTQSSSDPSNHAAHGRVYVNNSAVGTERTGEGTFTEDITVDDGDVIQVYGYVAGGSATGTFQNLIIKCSNPTTPQEATGY